MNLTPGNTVIQLTRGVLRNPGTALYAAGVAVTNPSDTLEIAGFSRTAKFTRVAGPYGLAAAALYGVKRVADTVAEIDDRRPVFSSLQVVKRLRLQPPLETDHIPGHRPQVAGDTSGPGDHSPADTSSAAAGSEASTAYETPKVKARLAALTGSRKRVKFSEHSPSENPLLQISPNPDAPQYRGRPQYYRKAHWGYLPYSRTAPKQRWLDVITRRKRKHRRSSI